MRRALALCCQSGLLLTCLSATAFLAADEDPAEEKRAADKSSASRLRAIREIMGQISMNSTDGDAPKLELKPEPLLRYNDVTRGILDSVVFRVGTKGRPVALISAELYGREGRHFLLNHEFVALYQPKLKMKRDVFIWEPPTGLLTLQEVPAAEPPVVNPRLRLTQMRRIAEQFSASQMVGASRIELQRMATPLDRYTPSDRPQADGSLFAFAWGLNPEAVLFVETDGKKWFYGWAPLTSAPLEVKLGEAVVWRCPRPTSHEDRRAAYTSIHRQLIVPDYFDDAAEEEPRDSRKP